MSVSHQVGPQLLLITPLWHSTLTTTPRRFHQRSLLCIHMTF
ncbi:hypothetical protein T05_16377 [Trichinella murrelli]|uniref:Uncharacterized protein n=1 Tax=Trichinella murrelli TaxID=144512 RepID=A0A0V0SRF2_9BILA|nr:hypothetical protein T05_16377 [Trichinella murrelli]